MTRTDHEFEKPISLTEAGVILGANIEVGDQAGGNFAIHIGGKTLFLNSETPIEFAVPKND